MGKTRPLTEAKISNEHNDKEERWRKLLQPYKVIKDPVHKDIWLTETEVRIIDTPEFQRLRYIRQLGPAHLIYPGAKHTRFDHCIGAVYVVQKIIDFIQKNSKIYKNAEQLTARDMVSARLAALLHDAAHLPFGHIIEDEGNLFAKNERQWKDKHRMGELLGEKSNIRLVIENSLKDVGLNNNDINKFIDELKKVLIAEEDGEETIKKLEHPYIADMVGNTICADLLDYVKRDIYFTGIFGQYDERIFSYFVISWEKDKNNEKRKRIAIRLYKEPNKPRFDVISAILDLIYLRYSIAEKVYYHHTRQKLSAMIIEMIEAAIKASILNKKELFKYSDDYLLKYIADYPSKKSQNSKYLNIAKNMAENILNRNLFKEVFSIGIYEYESLEVYSDVKSRIDELIYFWEKRFDFERTLEERLGLDEGSIIIYAPKPKMGGKNDIQTKVIYNNDILPLEEMAKKRIFRFIKKDIDLISNKHKNLWNFMVLCSKDIYDDYKDRIFNICSEWFKQEKPGKDIFSITNLSQISLQEFVESFSKIRSEGIQKSDKSSFRIALETVEIKLMKKKT